MKPLSLLLVLLAAAPAFAQDRAQNSAPLAQTADLFRSDLDGLTRIATAAALVHERTGAFPDTPFALLGSPEGSQTGARTFPLSDLTTTTTGDSLVLSYVPLPVNPYVREDLVVTATVRPDGAGRYAIRHEMRRRTDLEDGGRTLLYDRAGVYRVERGYGNLCVEAAPARAAIAAGRYEPAPASLPSGPLTLRVHPPGESEPVFYETSSTTAQ